MGDIPSDDFGPHPHRFNHRTLDHFDLFRRVYAEYRTLYCAYFSSVEREQRTSYEAVLEAEAPVGLVRQELHAMLAEELDVGEEWPEALCQMLRNGAMIRDKTMPLLHVDCGRLAPHPWHRNLVHSGDGFEHKAAPGPSTGSLQEPEGSNDTAQITPSSSSTELESLSPSRAIDRGETASHSSVASEDEGQEDGGTDSAASSGNVGNPVSESVFNSYFSEYEDEPTVSHVEFAGRWLFANESTLPSSPSVASAQEDPITDDHTWAYPLSFDQGVRMNLEEESFDAPEDMFNDPNMPLGESDRRFYENLLSEDFPVVGAVDIGELTPF